MRLMLLHKLNKLGYEVHLASNGFEALTLQKEHGVDLLLTDILMPDKDGLELISEFQNNYPNVKLIAMSGGSRISAQLYLKMATLMGPVGLLPKPFSMGDLELALAEATRV
ncbi:unnamed protein product [Phaeothamnion confervicola]